MQPQTIWRLVNPIKHYDWGSLTAVSQIFNYPNPTHQPIAEVWFGAHPQGTSKAITEQGECDLNQLIQRDPKALLGEKIAAAFDQKLPFLFKILSAQSPLSIQVHPDLAQAKAGFLRENQLNIALSDPIRNYKDPNHKPELTYAITPFYALNGFRECSEIIALFELLDCQALSSILHDFKLYPTEKGLEQFFKAILTLTEAQKTDAIARLQQQANRFDDLTQWAIQKISQTYTDDIGLLMPLVLNVLCLQPNQAIFLKAKTPHAYLFGTALEIMANSDNVLRAGLTPKNIDIKELLDNTEFVPIAKNQLLTQPNQALNQFFFPVPVSDFKFSIIDLTPDQHTIQTAIQTESAEILLCIEGEITIQAHNQTPLELRKGDSVFVSAKTKQYTCLGQGKLARAYC